MILQQIIDQIVNTDFGDFIGSLVDIAGIFGNIDCVSGKTCPGSAFNIITAAFATQGYWAQADLLDYLQYSKMGSIAALVYMISAIGGIFGMAMGAPPKAYLWFLIGPGIFHWMIQTTTPDTSVDGVRVMMGVPDTDYFDKLTAGASQSRVWQLAKVGLESSGISRRYKCFINGATGPICADGSDRVEGSGVVAPAYLFVVFDKYLSSIIENMVQWTGVYKIVDDDGFLGLGGGGKPRMSPDHLVTNLKWGVVEDITSAKLSSPDLRDLFVTFLSSECGDALTAGINPALFVSASSSKGGNLPSNIFYGGEPKTGDFSVFFQKLIFKSIPKPDAINHLLAPAVGAAKSSSFRFSLDDAVVNQLDGFFKGGTASCQHLFRVLVYGFRWEAGHIYYQMLTDSPPGMMPAQFLRNVILGWPIKEGILGGWGIGNIAGVRDTILYDLISAKDTEQFFINLILVHLIRNEFIIAPQPVSKTNSGKQDSISYAETYQKTVGQKSKFSELYTWALMTPYLQGVILYVLAMAYPFVCVLMIIPGWHGILFTWMSFWIWAKIWDLGFAIVTVLERSVWAMIGNNSTKAVQFSRVLEMKNWGRVTLVCEDGSNPLTAGICRSDKPIPAVFVDAKTATETFEELVRTAHIFDRAMTVGSSINLDLANSYYIYIMAALYFAVPAVTGQLVLGAKAGAASLAQNALGFAGEVSRASGSGFSGDLTKRAEANAASARQAMMAKEMRNGEAGNAMTNALEWGNQGLKGELKASALNTAEHGGYNRLAKNKALSSQDFQIANDIWGSSVGFDLSTKAGLMGIESKRLAAVGAKLNIGSQYGAALQSGIFGTIAAQSAMSKASPLTQANPMQQRAGLSGASAVQGAFQNGNRPALTGNGAVLTGNGASLTGSNPLNNIWGRVVSSKSSIDAAEANAASQVAALYADSFGLVRQATDYSTKLGNAYMQRANNNVQALNEAKQAGAAMDGFHESSLAKGLQQGAGIQKAYGRHLAETGTWRGMNRFAMQSSGTLAAMGVQGNPISAGQKPMDDTGFATAGLLGQANRERAFFAGGSGSAYGKIQAGYSSWLHNTFGEDAIRQAYQIYSPDQAGAFSLSVAQRQGGMVQGAMNDVRAVQGTYIMDPKSPFAGVIKQPYTDMYGSNPAASSVSVGVQDLGAPRTTPVSKGVVAANDGQLSSTLVNPAVGGQAPNFKEMFNPPRKTP